jgi:hypothetical protein
MARAVAFTVDANPSATDGSVGEATPRKGELDTGSGTMSDEQIIGFSFSGFTSVAIYDGNDNTGTQVAFAAAPGVYPWNEPIRLGKGLYIDVTGTGKGSIWLA